VSSACKPDEVCVVVTDDYWGYDGFSCEPNPCGSQPTTCACAGSVCGTGQACVGVGPGPRLDCYWGP
jgi:hypothetical protein